MIYKLKNEQIEQILSHTYVNISDIINEYEGADKEGFLSVFATILLDAIQCSYFELVEVAQENAAKKFSTDDLLSYGFIAPGSKFTLQDHSMLASGATSDIPLEKFEFDWDFDLTDEASFNLFLSQPWFDYRTIMVGNESVYYNAALTRDQELLEAVFTKAKAWHLFGKLDADIAPTTKEQQLIKI